MKIKILLLLFGICIIGSSCKKKYGEFYAAPTGQAGHLYEQMAADPSLSIFVSAIDRVPGLKDILNTSGLYTIMAPNNDAFTKYFASQSYKSINAIPISELSQLIKFHVLKYMLFQVNFLNPGITKLNFEQYKFETQDIAVFNDKLSNGKSKAIYYPGKQMQVYTPYYFATNAVTIDDYKTVYGTDAHISNDMQLNAMGGAVIVKDIAAGNGVIHIVDKVLVPPNNVAQELDTNPEFADYSALLKKRFLSYTYNQTATKSQGNNGDINGDGIVDSLWNRTYSINPYLDNENAFTPDKLHLVSITAFIPTKTAFANYLNTKFSGFATMDDVPASTLALLYNTHFTNSLDWPSKIGVSEASSGGDQFTVAKSDVVNVKMASNGLFYTVNKVFEPAAFKAVTGPAFFSPNYTYLANLLNQSGLLSLVTSNLGQYTLLGATNAGFANAGVTVSGTTFLKARTTGSPTAMTASEIKTLMGNNILVGSFNTSNLSDGFYLTQSGNYVAINGGKITGEIRTSQTSIVTPNVAETNGYFQGVDKIVPDPQLSIYDAVAASGTGPTPYSYLKFKELCTLAGVLIKDFVSVTAADAGTKYTLFVPSNEAIIAAQIAGLLPKTGAQGTPPVLDGTGKTRLFNYLKYFFVQRSVFTDGKVTGQYNTSKTDVNFNAVPLTITYPGNVLTITSVNNIQAKVLLTNPNNYPQNVIAKDGVIQVIDNAFTSQY